MTTILSTITGRNEDIFPGVARLYIADGDVIVDPTFGKGNFWRNVETDRYNVHFTDLVADQIDMCDLPYEDEFANFVVLDPPYMYNPKGTVKASLDAPYNLNAERLLKTNDAVIALYRDGMVEAQRILKPGGFMAVKCQDIIESNRQRWNHVNLCLFAVSSLGMYARDLFVLQQTQKPAIRWPHQKHSRKNHSYLWIFEKRSGATVKHQQDEAANAMELGT